MNLQNEQLRKLSRLKNRIVKNTKILNQDINNETDDNYMKDYGCRKPTKSGKCDGDLLVKRHIRNCNKFKKMCPKKIKVKATRTKPKCSIKMAAMKDSIMFHKAKCPVKLKSNTPRKKALKKSDFSCELGTNELRKLKHKIMKKEAIYSPNEANLNQIEKVNNLYNLSNNSSSYDQFMQSSDISHKNVPLESKHIISNSIGKSPSTVYPHGHCTHNGVAYSTPTPYYQPSQPNPFCYQVNQQAYHQHYGYPIRKPDHNNFAEHITTCNMHNRTTNGMTCPNKCCDTIYNCHKNCEASIENIDKNIFKDTKQTCEVHEDTSENIVQDTFVDSISNYNTPNETIGDTYLTGYKDQNKHTKNEISRGNSDQNKSTCDTSKFHHDYETTIENTDQNKYKGSILTNKTHDDTSCKKTSKNKYIDSRLLIHKNDTDISPVNIVQNQIVDDISANNCQQSMHVNTDEKIIDFTNSECTQPKLQKPDKTKYESPGTIQTQDLRHSRFRNKGHKESHEYIATGYRIHPDHVQNTPHRVPCKKVKKICDSKKPKVVSEMNTSQHCNVYPIHKYTSKINNKKNKNESEYEFSGFIPIEK